MKAYTLIVSAGLAAAALAHEPAPVVFDTPAKDEKGVMVLGNGEVGATAWLDAAGTLHTVLQNSDSWNEGGRHVKTGAIDYETKSPVDAGTYRQELSMERGEFEATWKSGGRAVSLRYRIQQGTDSIAVCDVRGAPEAEAKVVNWRLYPGGSKVFGVGEYELGIRFCEGYFVDNVRDRKFVIRADHLVPGGWCHVNRNETVADLMKVYDYYQATGDLGKPDLLSDRAFGGMTRTVGAGGRKLFLSAITCYHPCKDADEWLRRTNGMLDRDGWTIAGEEAKRAAHIAWWRAFWNRSHIAITPSEKAKKVPRKPYALPTNGRLPLRFGVDARNGNKFLGTFMSAEATFGGNVVYSGVPKVGDSIRRPFPAARDGDAFRFACRFTTDQLQIPQRLLDNMTPGGSDGFIIDVYLGRVRGLFGKTQFHHSAKIVPGRETTLEVRVSKYGTAEIAVNGKSEKKELGRPPISLADECAAIATAYAAQRYLTACAARGRLPIRFNGSLFTVSHNGDPDYRRWGNGYWWQNTRLPYYPMFAAGDIDGTDALFDMYFGKLEFLKRRTRKYFGHDGAYFPECMQPWGDHFIGSYGPECEWRLRKDKHQCQPCHKYAWVGQMELSLMAIMRWQHTRDDGWFKKNALPSIREYVRYFDGHFKLDAAGRYHMYPAQAVETWQDCTNPMTEASGLLRVTDLMLALPDRILSAEDRAFFAKVRARVPDLPTRKLKDGRVVFAPAERFARHGNVETPELYCVFPFRLCSFEKPNAEIGRRTYTDGRFHKLYFGWAQDEVNAAYLGMAEEAREHVVDRVFKNTPTLGRTIGCNEEDIAERAYRPSEYRWPAYWGPNYNWRPDQDEGGIFQSTIQSMLLQYEGDRIFLLPAWPKEWDCDFKLHAPRNTIVEGRVVDGELKDLVVTPASRRKDVTMPSLAAAPEPVGAPDLLTSFDGTKVATAERWEKVRAPELLALFAREAYGRRPAAADERGRVSFDVYDAREALGGKAVRKLVRATYRGPNGTFTFPFTAFIPKTATAARPAPAFVLACNIKGGLLDAKGGLGSVFWPVEEIVARGYATAAFRFDVAAADTKGAGFSQGIYPAVQPESERDDASWATLSAWAWADSRLLDWMESEPLIDARHVGVVGHSRGGKTAIWAGVTDRRFAMVCSNNSGCSGAKLNHIDLPKSEHIRQILKSFPYWFCKNYQKYAGREMTMAFDQHELLALVAPRLLCVASATEDHWAGQRGEWWAAKLASPAWELYGKRGLVADAYPEPERPQQEGCVSYHLRKGPHFLAPYDWHRYMDFADRHGWRGGREPRHARTLGGGGAEQGLARAEMGRDDAK